MHSHTYHRHCIIIPRQSAVQQTSSRQRQNEETKPPNFRFLYGKLMWVFTTSQISLRRLIKRFDRYNGLNFKVYFSTKRIIVATRIVVHDTNEQTANIATQIYTKCTERTDQEPSLLESESRILRMQSNGRTATITTSSIRYCTSQTHARAAITNLWVGAWKLTDSRALIRHRYAHVVSSPEHTRAETCRRTNAQLSPPALLLLPTRQRNHCRHRRHMLALSSNFNVDTRKI